MLSKIEWIFIAVFLVFLYFVIHGILGVFDERDHLKNDNADLIVKLKDQKDLIEKERSEAREIAERDKQTLADKQKIQDAYDEKVRCIADGSCAVKLRWIKAVCASVPSTEPGETRPDAGTVAELKDFARWDNDLEKSISENDQLIKDLQKEYTIKSAPDYCQPK